MISKDMMDRIDKLRRLSDIGYYTKRYISYSLYFKVPGKKNVKKYNGFRRKTPLAKELIPFRLTWDNRIALYESPHIDLLNVEMHNFFYLIEEILSEITRSIRSKYNLK